MNPQDFTFVLRLVFGLTCLAFFVWGAIEFYSLWTMFKLSKRRRRQSEEMRNWSSGDPGQALGRMNRDN